MKILMALAAIGLFLIGTDAHATRSRSTSPRVRSAEAPRQRTPTDRISKPHPTKYYRKDHKPRTTDERGPQHKDFNYDQWGVK